MGLVTGLVATKLILHLRGYVTMVTMVTMVTTYHGFTSQAADDVIFHRMLHFMYDVRYKSCVLNSAFNYFTVCQFVSCTRSLSLPLLNTVPTCTVIIGPPFLYSV